MQSTRCGSGTDVSSFNDCVHVENTIEHALVDCDYRCCGHADFHNPFHNPMVTLGTKYTETTTKIFCANFFFLQKPPGACSARLQVTGIVYRFRRKISCHYSSHAIPYFLCFLEKYLIGDCTFNPGSFPIHTRCVYFRTIKTTIVYYFIIKFEMQVSYIRVIFYTKTSSGMETIFVKNTNESITWFV